MRIETLLPVAEQVAALLKQRGETIAVAESSTGGLISATLLAVPGASAYFLGGAVVYTRLARDLLMDIPHAALLGMRSASEPYALLLARTAQKRFAVSWGLAETGAAGPTGNRYGDAPGHSCVALAGGAEQCITIETARDDRLENMHAFARAALEMLARRLSK
jgi:PncC family amidohydrolase